MGRGRPFLQLLLAAAAGVPCPRAGADEFVAAEHKRQTVYHSPQTPGYTCWTGAWVMPGGDLMVAFTQATGPVAGRAKAPKELMEKLTWYPEYDMTGLDLRNVH